MDIKLNVPRPELGTGEIRLVFPERNPNEGKKNLANLSDQDLANLSPEEIAQARQVRQNLLEIKKADREVDDMVQQEQLEQRINEYMAAKGLSREQAELLARQDFGLVGPSNMGPLFIQPPEDPITKALKEIIAERAKEIFLGATAPGGNKPANAGGGQPAPDMAQVIKTAKEQGVSGIYMPDGTLIQLKPADSLGDELVKQAADWVKGKMPDLLNPDPKTGTELLSSHDPAIIKLGLEYRAKEEERKTAEILAQGRTEAAKEFAAVLGSIVGGDGYKRIKEFFDGMKAARHETGNQMVAVNCKLCQAENRVAPLQEVFTCEGCGSENEIEWKK